MVSQSFIDALDKKNWTCSICGKVVSPIFQTSDKDGVPHLYCSDHNPVTDAERKKMWGITPDMEQLRSKRGRPKS